MATISIEKKRKAVDLPIEAIRNLAVMAAAKGTSVKQYMEGILLSQAEQINAVIKNPSPSGDAYFADPRNIERILHSCEQAEQGKTNTLKKEDINSFLGL